MGKKKNRVIRSTDKAIDGKVLPKNEVEAMAKAPGFPLPENIRTELESSLGEDLRDVRVHTGDNAFRVLNSINARAFTFGQHIYIKGSDYDPISQSGKFLLAHELAHTIQQKK